MEGMTHARAQADTKPEISQPGIRRADDRPAVRVPGRSGRRGNTGRKRAYGLWTARWHGG